MRGLGARRAVHRLAEQSQMSTRCPAIALHAVTNLSAGEVNRTGDIVVSNPSAHQCPGLVSIVAVHPVAN